MLVANQDKSGQFVRSKYLALGRIIVKVFRLLGVPVVLIALVTAFMAAPAAAASNCVFTDTGSSWILQGDCTTDTSIVVPDGYTLDGNGNTITGVDPAGGHFVGAVVVNGGSSMYVQDVNLTVSDLTNVCDVGNDRLRGIMFQGASGEVSHSSVIGINQGPATGCQEGNAIEVRNSGDFDGINVVEIDHNVIDAYQKTGIVANGDVSVTIEHNVVGSSVDQHDLAANSVQFGFGGAGSLIHNDIMGNQWFGASDDVATAVLLYQPGAVTVSDNNIAGNSDTGIYAFGDNLVIDNNRIFDSGVDVNQHGYDIGIGNYGNNSVTNNKVRGFDTPYDGVVGGNNKVVASPHS